MKTHQHSILVLEDDDNLRELICETLEDEGYHVLSCSDPENAIATAKQFSPHLILTDVRMAGSTDGVGAVEIIKRYQPRIRTVVMTGYASQDVPLRAAQLKADDYLLKGDKGFGVAELVRVVRSALNRKPAGAGLLSRLVGLGHRLGQMTLRFDPQLPQLEAEREDFYIRFFLLIRPGHLSRERAHLIWTHLELLEREYEQLRTAQGLAPLLRGYQRLQDALADGELELIASDLSREQFQPFYQRVREGRVDQSQFQRAVQLRIDHQARNRSSGDFALFHLLWSPPQDVQRQDLCDQVVDGYRILRPLESTQQVRRYLARTPQKEEVIAEVIPLTRENESLLERHSDDYRHVVRLSGQAILFRAAPSQARTLRGEWRPGGLSPEQAWSLVAPLVGQLEQFHREGLYDGIWSPSEVSFSALTGSRLEGFGPGRYERARAGLQRGRLDGFKLGFSDPYLIDSRAQLGPHSDQACLAATLLYLLMGEGPETGVVRAMGVGQGQPLLSGPWAQFWSQPLERMLSLPPDTRYASVTEAAQQLQAALASSRQLSMADAYRVSQPTIQQAWDWWKPVLAAVQRYHEQGIYDGSLSPQRVRFSTAGATIEDFGQERERHRQSPFSAPEMWAHPLVEIDEACDQFCLGMLFYGFLLDPVHRPRLRDLYPAHVRRDPELEVAPQHRALGQVLARMLRISPGERYPSLQEALLSLDHCVGALMRGG